jgi:hypothetical protein
LSQGARARINERQSIEASAGKWIELLGKIGGQSPSKHAIELPRYLRLPPVHPALASADVRRVGPPLPVRFYRRTRILAGHFKRRLLGQPLS